MIVIYPSEISLLDCSKFLLIVIMDLYDDCQAQLILLSAKKCSVNNT